MSERKPVEERQDPELRDMPRNPQGTADRLHEVAPPRSAELGGPTREQTSEPRARPRDREAARVAEDAEADE